MDKAAGPRLTLGLISDTHGMLRPEALRALAGVDLLLHAGDVGSPRVLEGLAEVAPLRAVRGNVDGPPLSSSLAETEVVEAGALQLYLLHDLGKLDLDPAACGFAAVVSGHSHVAKVFDERGVLFINPGSAGPRRFGRPASVGRIRIVGRQLTAELIELADGPERVTVY